MKEAAEFFLDYLVPDAKGRLVSGPSRLARESVPAAQRAGRHSVHGAVDGPPDHPRSVHADDPRPRRSSASTREFRDAARAMRKRLPAPADRQARPDHGMVARTSTKPEPGHRHISQLFALHPGDADHAPRHARAGGAARATLERRLAHGGGHTGWSRAWIINFWARLEDGDQAYENLCRAAREVDAAEPVGSAPAVSDRRQLRRHRRHRGDAAAEPRRRDCTCCPRCRRRGPMARSTGLRARGGVEVDVTWAKGRATAATLRPQIDVTHRVRAPRDQRIVSVRANGGDVPFKSEGGAVVVPMRAGLVYQVRFE